MTNEPSHSPSTGLVGQATPLGPVLFGGRAGAVSFRSGRVQGSSNGGTSQGADTLSFRVDIGAGALQLVEIRSSVIRGSIAEGDIVGIIDGKQKRQVHRAKQVWNFTTGTPVTGTLRGALPWRKV